jgi:glucose/arabinose dehydrogenase
MRIPIREALFCTLLAACAAGCVRNSEGEPAPAGNYRLVEAYPALQFVLPVDLQPANDGSRRIFVVSQAGTIHVFPDTADVRSATTFLDIRPRVTYGGETGLLGLAFHPDFRSNGLFFVNYTAANPLRTVIARFTAAAGRPDSADPASELILLEVQQPYSNHNGGQTSFGPDGFLYTSLGDGGSAGDPQNEAQNRGSLLGKILRIDVDNPSGNRRYGIPADNPFARNSQGFREEIYAYGLRNVWRFSFDANTGELWGADVGQNAWEEIDLIRNGGNYGWRVMEGRHCFNPAVGCDTAGLVQPVWEYAHGDDGCSVTGGFVYRGAALAALAGRYVFGDFCSGRIWALHRTGASASALLLADTDVPIASFGLDTRGEILACGHADGKIYRLIASP